MKRLLAPVLALLIALWPPLALAGGILLTIPGAPALGVVSSPPGPAPTVNQIVVATNSTPFNTAPSATFGADPAVGDWLVAVLDGAFVSPSAGWTEFYAGPNCHTYGPQVVAVYHQVQAGDGATFKPFGDTGAGILAVAIYDISGAQSTWAAAYQGTFGTCDTGSSPLTVTAATGGPNTLVLAANVAFIPTEGEFGGNPGLTGITGDLQTTYVNNGGNNAAGVAAAWASYSNFTDVSVTGSMDIGGGSCGFCGLGVALIMFNAGP